jgi:general secretion pathway protein N
VARWSWLALGVGAYLAFTLSSFPASVAYGWFVPPEVKLAGLDGTLWSGRAAAGSVASLPLHDVRWRVRPWALLIGRLGADIEARLADGFVSARVSASPSRVRLSDVRGSTSLPTLRGALPVSGVQGGATLDLSNLEIANGRLVAVVGKLTLAKIEVTPFVPGSARGFVPIGDYVVQFLESSAPGVNAKFNDTGGPLEASGTLVLDAALGYTLDGSIKPRPDAAPELVQGLDVIAADPDAEGRRHLTLMGTL